MRTWSAFQPSHSASPPQTPAITRSCERLSGAFGMGASSHGDAPDASPQLPRPWCYNVPQARRLTPLRRQLQLVDTTDLLNSPPPILQVVFDTPLRRSFDYLAPAGAAPPRPGARVRVPLGRRRAIGLVAAHAEESALPRPRLKPVIEAIDAAPLWDEVTFGLLLWAADYYHHPLGDVLFGAMPKMLRRGAPAAQDVLVWMLSDAGRAAIAGGARLGRRQQALVALLGATGATTQAIAEAGHQAVVRDFAARGWIESHARPEEPPPAGAGRPGPVLTAA